MERLSHIIQEAIEDGSWKPITLAPGGPQLSHLFFANDLILFADASVSQVETILACLDRFCDASGQAVNKDKSVIFCSKNTDRRTAAAISSTLGIPLTQNLGKYLGVPILHERTTRFTYQEIIDRLDQRLSGWKARSLSLAGRVTLAQSILTAIPAYAMQTSVLPASTCEAIDKRIRDFVWGSTADARKIPLIAWDRICLPKEQGGLGLRMARELNRAYMTKLAFIFFQQADLLWVKILQNKYFRETKEGFRPRNKSSQSPLWQAGDDEWVWGEETNGKFSIRSAYNLIHSAGPTSSPEFWRRIWSWKGPNKIPISFGWLRMTDY
ncbi:Putative ribonuclease H protein At1g65750 [Linum perenne]